MAFVPGPSEDRAWQSLLHLGDWIHLTDWTRTLKSYPLLMSQRIVWTCVPPCPTPTRSPPLRGGCLQSISGSVVVRLCSDPHTSTGLCEELSSFFFFLNVPQLCGEFPHPFKWRCSAFWAHRAGQSSDLCTANKTTNTRKRRVVWFSSVFLNTRWTRGVRSLRQNRFISAKVWWCGSPYW